MNTNLFKFLLVISTFLTLSGCGTFISANINSSIDPSFTPRINNRIVIVSKDYKSAYYLPILKEALVNRGFSDISISQSNSMSYGYDLTVVLDVGRQLSEATKTVQDYGVVGQDVDWGETKCKTTNNGLTGERMRCKTGETKVKNIYGVTGTREEKTTNLSRSISLVFSHGSNNKTIMSAIGTSSEDDYTCSDSGIYKALIIYTTKRLSFSGPVNYNYTVEIPEGYSCETVAEYERSQKILEEYKQSPDKLGNIPTANTQPNGDNIWYQKPTSFESLLENNTVPAAIQKKTVDNQYSATKNSQRAITSTPNPDQDIYEIAELGVSVRSYYGQLSATINQNFTGSHQVSNKGGVVVVAVSSGGKASRLDIKQGDRIVSYTKKGLGFGSVVINNSQELKTIAQKNGSKHFRNFYIIRNGSRFVECAKLGMFSC